VRYIYKEENIIGHEGGYVVNEVARDFIDKAESVHVMWVMKGNPLSSTLLHSFPFLPSLRL
jgi:anaerobic selenocysteine-containing dehydrogenase